MEKFTGLTTTDGKPVITNEFIADLREREKDKIQSNNFVAQVGPQEDDLHASVDILITGGNRGGGKANTYYTPIVTPYGYKRMGELEVGDEICTPYEGVQKVTNIFEQGEKTIYSFHFDDGTSVQCMDEHRFWAKLTASGDYKELTAREIMNNYKLGLKNPQSLRSGREYTEIPLCGEVKMQENVTPIDLPIHPFLFGLIAGKGVWHFAKIGVSIVNAPRVLQFAYKMGYKPKKINGFYYLKGITDETDG